MKRKKFRQRPVARRALYYRVYNYASRQMAESRQSVQTLVYKTPPLPGVLVAYWPIPNRDPSLTGRVILHKVVSSLLTRARLYEFSRRLAYHLWYTLANSPIGFWNRLNPTFTMTGHFFRHSTPTIVTTTLPNTGTEIWSMSGANCKFIDIFWRLEDAGVTAVWTPPSQIWTPYQTFL